MNKEYICNADGRTFLDENEALQYIKSKFLEVVEKQEGLEFYENEFKAAFPEFIVKVTKRQIEDDDRHYSRNYKDTDKEEIQVQLKGINIEANFFFSFLNRETDLSWSFPWNYDGSNGVFPNMDKALWFYKMLINNSSAYKEKLFNELKKYKTDLKEVVIYKIRESCGTADDFNEYYSRLVMNDESVLDYGYFSFDKYDMESEETLYQEMDKYIDGIKGAYVNVIEGEVAVGTPKYCNDHSTWYEVDGVAIDSLASRAKRLRVEILETR